MKRERYFDGVTQRRIMDLAERTGAQPTTICKAAIGRTLASWFDGKGYGPRPHTLANINRWLDDNKDWRPRGRPRPYAGRIKTLRPPTPHPEPY